MILDSLGTATYRTGWIFAFTRVYESPRSVERCQVQLRGEICPETPPVPQETKISHGKRSWNTPPSHSSRQQPVRSHTVRRCRNARSAPDSSPLKPFQSQIVGMLPEQKAHLQAKTLESDCPETPMPSRTWSISWFVVLVSAAIQPEHSLLVVNVTPLSIALS